VSKPLRVAVSWYQYEAGVSWSLFEDVKTSVKYTSARWLSSLKNFLATINGHFDLDDVYITPPQREHDIHLMDLVTRSEAFTEKEAAILNHCRMYLNVTMVSDISTAKGDMLIPGVEWGGLDLMPSRNTEHTNHQQAPAISFWTYWQRLLRVISNPQGKLFGHLGNWLEPGGRLRRKWNAYFDPKYKFLYCLQHDRYQQYELFDTRVINGCSTPWQPNDHCVPVSIRETSHDCWELLTASPALPGHPEHPITAQTFQEYVQQLPDPEQHLFASMELLYEPYELLRLFNAELATNSDDESSSDTTSPISPPTIHMVSDGSEHLAGSYAPPTDYAWQSALVQHMVLAALIEQKQQGCSPHLASSSIWRNTVTC
jgi:hypothetical protein